MGKIQEKKRNIKSLDENEQWWGTGVKINPDLKDVFVGESEKMKIANEIIAKIDFESLKKYE
ncbi:hypothetical protein ACLI1A_17605 [Flavobacterium sp. RHBU_3]|uniref:hypothetical protein n=1 Tax=Flavobacterium sp. RHBU_3 TaxID=3391184 RepID=UPI0039847ED2